MTVEAGDQSVILDVGRRGRVPRRRAALLQPTGSTGGAVLAGRLPARSRARHPHGALAMTDVDSLETFLAGAQVDSAVVHATTGLPRPAGRRRRIAPGRATRRARRCCRRPRTRRPALERPSAWRSLPHVAAWREAYRAFGAKPQRTRNSLEALTASCACRAAAGQPAHRPLQRRLGAPPDPTRRGGPDSLHRPTAADPRHRPGAVRHRRGRCHRRRASRTRVRWSGATTQGVTCRRWNWRQARRTQLTDETTTALFILDALDPMTDEALAAAADDLIDHLTRLGPDVHTARRLITPGTTPVQGD